MLPQPRKGNFTEKDLHLSSPFELAGFVHIEAGFDNSKPWREIAWLERTCSLPFRSIAGINLLLPSNDFQQTLDKLCQYKSVVGVRDILDENAFDYLSNPLVRKNLALLELPGNGSQVVVYEGQKIGKNNALVKKISKNQITLEENNKQITMEITE